MCSITIRLTGLRFVVGINQHWIKERSIQVSDILTIFQKASKVIVWLGNEGSSTSCALRKLRETETTFTRPGSDILGDKDKEHRSVRSNEREAIEEGIRELLQRPWFRRVWVCYIRGA